MKIACVGDLGVDFYSDHKKTLPGGCSLNCAVHLKRNSGSANQITVVSALGDDENARIVERTIESEGLESCLQRVKGKTPYSAIKLLENGERVFTEYDPGVLISYQVHEDAKEVLRTSDWVMSVVFNQVTDFFDSVVAAPKGGGFSVDFMDMNDWEKNPEVVRKYVDSIDIGFFGLSLKDGELIHALKVMAREKKKLFVITLGPKGSIAFAGENEFRGVAEPVEAVDTTGAGDSFSAAFIENFLKSQNVPESLQAAHQYSAKVVKTLGSF